MTYSIDFRQHVFPERLNTELLSYEKALIAIENIAGVDNEDYKTVKRLYDNKLEQIETIKRSDTKAGLDD